MALGVVVDLEGLENEFIVFLPFILNSDIQRLGSVQLNTVFPLPWDLLWLVKWDGGQAAVKPAELGSEEGVAIEEVVDGCVGVQVELWLER